ncbi:thioesterase domain-containing protein [Actinosynnema sp. NPDC002837]
MSGPGVMAGSRHRPGEPEHRRGGHACSPADRDAETLAVLAHLGAGRGEVVEGQVGHHRLDVVGHRRFAVDQVGVAPPPRDLVGQEVAACWQEGLGEPPGEGGFFDAGGGSYDVIRLLSLLRARFGYAVSFGDFMVDPTVAGLAARCRHARQPDQIIWTYQPRAAATPRLRLVLFPPVGGGVSCYSPVVRDLPVDVEAHVVGFDGPQPDDALTLPDLARRCVERLPADVRSGDVPLVLGGWSFGGALAFEVARVCGASVARVVVVDTPVSAGSRGVDEPSLAGFAADVRETSGVNSATLIQALSALEEVFDVDLDTERLFSARVTVTRLEAEITRALASP